MSTKDFAEAIGASESSLRRWTNLGVIKTFRTVGGHRRIALSEAVRFIRESHATVVRPEKLGLPPQASQTGGASEAVEREIGLALERGETEIAKSKILALYLGGASISSIFDGPIQHAMRRLGELWQHSPEGILIEHRATDICIQAISKLREILPSAGGEAPVAVGGTPQGDPYLLSSLMVATVLADAGYRGINYGPNTPVDILAAGARLEKASLVWLSFNVIENKSQLQRDVEKLCDQLLQQNARLIIGGRQAGEINTRHLPNVYLLKSMTELAAFTRGAKPLPPPGTAKTA